MTVIKIKETVCPACKGEQWLYEFKGDELIAKRCVCLDKKLLRAFIGDPDIYKAKWVKSELYHKKSEDELEDKTADNLFIKGSWDVVCQHLHWVLSAKYRENAGFTFKVIKDTRLLRVWLGDESYQKRPKEVRDKTDIYNNLLDLLPHSTLVIIRLGFLERRNKAMPDVLHEALKIREHLPTWVVEGSVKYTAGHLAYNDNVGSYIDNKFEKINLGGDVEAERRIINEESEEALDYGIAMGPGTNPPKLDRGADTYEIPESGFKKPFRRPKPKGSGGLPDLE